MATADPTDGLEKARRTEAVLELLWVAAVESVTPGVDVSALTHIDIRLTPDTDYESFKRRALQLVATMQDQPSG